MKNLTGQSADYSHEEHDHVSSQILESEEEITQLQESHPKGEIERKLAYWTRGAPMVRLQCYLYL